LKRSFDFCVAVFGLVLLSPLLAAVALMVWIEDRGPIFFVGHRVGFKGAEFRMIKFRTMTPDAWMSGVNSTADGDRRVTQIGKRLRRFKLDELPQLWNVVTGEMSLVGPRPQVPAEVSTYTAEEQHMLLARPGITDLASIVFADEGAILADASDPDLLYNQVIRPWKSRLALMYVKERSMAADIRILALTLISGIARERALAGVVQVLVKWHAEEMLVSAARRREPLRAWHPPGSHVLSKAGACST
jgi:lipopolysaccharide/colanic/teichoic acid biosynthesis glycosyltransferase